jgi:hypothetical protein
MARSRCPQWNACGAGVRNETVDDSQLVEGKAMSQDPMERAIGQLVTAEDLRERFVQTPAVASWSAGC